MKLRPCARANARRSPAPATSLRPARRPRGCWPSDYGVPPERMSVVEPGTDRGRSVRPRKRADGDGRAARGRRGGAAQGLRCAGRRARQARSPRLAARHCRRLRAKPGNAPPAARPTLRAWAWPTASPCSAPSPRSSSRRFTHRPICSCCPRASRAMAWPMPKRSPMACRSSARRRARFRRRCRPMPACWCRPMMSRRWRPRCGA